MTNVNEGAANPAQKTVLLGVTGCIAAYKSCEIVRGLQKAGVRVKVVMTEHATEFVGPTTFRALTHETVAVGLFDDPVRPHPPRVARAGGRRVPSSRRAPRTSSRRSRTASPTIS